MKHYTKSEVRQAVNKALMDTLHVSEGEIGPSASLKWDLMADSLDGIQIAMQLERELNVTITDYQTHELQNGTVDDLYNMMYELIK